MAKKAEEITIEKRTKIIAQIKKVLALAKDNPSIEEGLAAALKAQELMVKYNIHEQEVEWEEVKDEISSVFISEIGKLVLMAWRKQLAVIVARNFRCKCYMRGNAVAFRGYTQDIKIAAEVFKTLYDIGERLGYKAEAEVRKMYGTAKGVHNTFIAGFLKGIEEGFGEQCTALMVVTPKEVEDEFEHFSKDFKPGRGKALEVIDSGIFEKGVAEGKNAVKARQVEKKGR